MIPLTSKKTSLAGDWERNSARADCSSCNRKFGVFLRRHHCRSCGKLFCASCTTYKISVASSRTGKSKRACAMCFAVAGASGSSMTGGGGGGGGPGGAAGLDESSDAEEPDINLEKGEGRRTARELAVAITADAVLKELRTPLGNWNWALFVPTQDSTPLVLENAGSLGLNECVKWLKPTEPLYGLLRLGFGFGRFRRTKLVFITWMPSQLSVSARKLASDTMAHMRRVLGGGNSIEMSATSLEDCTLEELMRKAKALEVSGETALEDVNQESYYKALEEEAKLSSEFFDEVGGGR